MHGPRDNLHRPSSKAFHLYGELVKPLPRLFDRWSDAWAVRPVIPKVFEVLTAVPCPLGCGGSIYYDDERQRFCTLCADKWRMA